MPDPVAKNLKIQSSSLGLIVIQPVTLYVDEIEKASLLLFPHGVNAAELNVCVEWAASSQTPIFCLSDDVEKFEDEGFGSYRFHKIDGYREVDFQGGSIEFYPARKRRVSGIRGITQEVVEFFGFAKHPGYHVLVRPRGEAPVLYLATTVIDASEWRTLTKSNPQTIVGSSAFTKSEWHAFSTLVKRRVLLPQEVEQVTTQAQERAGQAESTPRENPLWAVKTGSL